MAHAATSIRVVFFSSLAEATGVRELKFDCHEGLTVGDALNQLSEQHPPLAAMRSRLATAVNMEYVDADHPLHPGDELALIPPVSGG